jgi:membrane-associated phospholipid phosphatase
VAVVSVLWVAYPRAWPLWAAAAGSVMVGLVGMNYHFVGDVIAGAVLGTVTGMYTGRFLGLSTAREGTAPRGLPEPSPDFS